ncbi:MAG: hypothetical protein AB7O52_11130 [Planctomycetota bacterium]
MQWNLWRASTRLVLGLGACALLVGGVSAQEEAGPPSPRKTILNVAKKLAKTKSYSSTCAVVGGVAGAKSDDLNQTVVNEQYEASVFGTIMHLPKMQAFRSGFNKGAVNNGGIWQSILATAEGARVDRLFGYPTDILATAMQGAEKVYWRADQPQAVEPSDEEESDEEQAEPVGRTGVVKRDANAELPTVLRVELSPKHSIERFTTVENSGCMSGG